MAKPHRITKEDLMPALENCRIELALSRTEFGRKSLAWEPYTTTFVVMFGERLVSAGKDLDAAITAYNEAY